jgi:hypothetical protein
MTNNILEKIDGIFKHPESLTMQELEGFVHEMLGFFETLRTTMVTGTEDEKKEAMEMTQEVQQKLQILAQKAYEKTGMSEAEIQKFLTAGNFPKTDFKLFQNAQNEIEEYKKAMEPPKKSKTPRHKI